MTERELILIDDRQLHRLRARLPLLEYTRQLWRRRSFIRMDAVGKSMRNGKDTFLGKAWVVLDPLFQVILYGLVFGVILGTSRGMDNFVGFLTIGVVFFRISTKGFSSGIGLVQRSRALITSFNFPRAAVVLSTAIKNFLDSIAPAVVGVVVALGFQLDKPIPWTVILNIPLLFLIQFFALGCSFIVARATAFIPDLRSFVNLITRALFFVSGIFFSLSRYEGHTEIMRIMEANPIYQFLTFVRTCTLEGQIPSPGVWLYLSMWSFGIAVVGYIYFWQADERYINV